MLSTLRRVLETEFGYSVCIFDRDSLPGGSELCLRALACLSVHVIVLIYLCVCSYNRRYAEVCGSESQAGGCCESVQRRARDSGPVRAAGRTDQHDAGRQSQGGSDPVQTGPEAELGQRAPSGPPGADAHTVEGREIRSSFLAVLETTSAGAAHETTRGQTHNTDKAHGHATHRQELKHTQHTLGKHTSRKTETYRVLIYMCSVVHSLREVK